MPSQTQFAKVIVQNSQLSSHPSGASFTDLLKATGFIKVDAVSVQVVY